MAAYLVFLLCCYLFAAFTMADPPKSGFFFYAPSLMEKYRDKPLTIMMRDYWFVHSIVMIKNMTHEILIDVDAKLTHAEYIKQKYEKSITFQLGTTAASIMDEFEEMLIIYRMYANMTTFKKERRLGGYDLRSFNEAFLSIQGKYHQIRVEEHLFYNAVDRLKLKREKIKRYREKYPKVKSVNDVLRSRDNQQNISRTKDNQRNTLRTRDNKQDIIRTRNNQQNMLRTRDNQQNTERVSKANSFEQIRPVQSPKVSDFTKVANQNIERSIKKPLWVYKEADEDKFY